jgi:hypothetical protein
MRPSLVLVASAAAAASLAACGSGVSQTAATGDVKGETPAQVLASASHAASRAGTAHYVLVEKASNQTQTITGDASSTEGHQVVTTGRLHVEVVLVRGVAYVEGDAGGLGTALGLPGLLAVRYANQWITVRSSDTPYASIVQALTLNGTISQLRPTGRLRLTGEAIIGGRSAIGVGGGLPGQPQAGVTGSTTLYVASSRPTVPLKFMIQATVKGQHLEDVATFTQWGTPLHLSAPTGGVAFSSIRTH